MTDWQDRDNGDAVLDGWYAILVSWGTPWEEDTPDVLLFRDGAWVQRQKDCSLPNFYYFQGPFQSSMEARDWGHAHDGVGKYLAERAEEALRARAALEAQSKPQGPTNEDRPMPAAIRDMPEQQQRWYAMGWQAALARFGRPAIEPVPQGLTDEELETTARAAEIQYLKEHGGLAGLTPDGLHAQLQAQRLAGLRAVAARWGRPANTIN